MDDAFIAFRYARNWAEGLGPVYQAGERVEGYTSFAWVALLALAHRAGLDIETTAKVLGLLSAAATLPAAALLAERLVGPSRAARAAPFLIALSPLSAAWTSAGMEVMLFAAVIAWASVALLAECETGRPPRWSPVLFGVSVWVRPEGFLMATVALLAVHAFSPRADRGHLFSWTWRFAAVALPFWLGRWAYYGHFFPNTFTAKTGGSLLHVRYGVFSVRDFLADAGPAWWAMWLAGLPLVRLGRVAWRLPILTIASYVAYVAGAGGDVLHLRLYVHIVPQLAACAAAGLAWGGGRLARAAPWMGAGARTGLACALALGWAFASDAEDRRAIRSLSQRGAAYVATNGRNIAEVNLPLGRWLGRHASPGWRLATGDIGGIGYGSALPIVDLYGLTDSELPRLARRHAMDHEKLAWLRRRDPHLLVTFTRPDGSLPSLPTFWQEWVAGRYRLHSLWGEGPPGSGLGLFVRRDLTLPPR